MDTIKGTGLGHGNGRRGRPFRLTLLARDLNGSSAHNGAADAGLHIETLRMRAYELFLERGAIHGDDLADWFRAEHELRAASSF